MQQIVGNSSDLQEGGRALNFYVETENGRVPAFVIRYSGQVHGYLNQCAHLGIPLDIRPGHVFGNDGKQLICAAHGARYQADSGACAGGPCFGVGLLSLQVYESEGKVVLDDKRYQLI